MAQTTLPSKAKDKNDSDGEGTGDSPTMLALGIGHSRSWARRPAGVWAGQPGWRPGTHRVMARVGVFVVNCLQPGGAAAVDGVDGRHQTWAQGGCPSPRPLDQEPFRVGEEVREEGGVWEAGGPAVCPLLREAPQRQGRGG